jgi:hypothetical protein
VRRGMLVGTGTMEIGWLVFITSLLLRKYHGSAGMIFISLVKRAYPSSSLPQYITSGDIIHQSLGKIPPRHNFRFKTALLFSLMIKSTNRHFKILAREFLSYDEYISSVAQHSLAYI